MATYSERLEHELVIYKLLKRAGLSQIEVDSWVNTPHVLLQNSAPIEIMQGTLNDISGLLIVRTMLEDEM